MRNLNNNPIFNRRNFIALEEYLISPDLQRSLESGILHNNEVPVKNNTDEFHVVLIRVLKRDERKLVYGTINYPNLFYLTYMHFLCIRSRLMGISYKEPGDFLSLCDMQLKSSKDELRINMNFGLDINRDINYMINSGNPITYKEIIKVINKLVFLESNIQIMSQLVDLAFKNDHKNIIYVILSWVENYSKLTKILSDNKNTEPISFINNCLFVVKDLDKFISFIRDKDYNINQGPQPLRGRVNDINRSLSLLDKNYCDSLYNHNSYHCEGTRLKLSRDKFYYHNIHNNIGGKRLYSTKVSLFMPVSPRRVVILNIPVRIGLIRKSSNTAIQNKEILTNSIYKQLRIFLDNNPTNADTQKKIESFILSQYNWWESIKPSYSILDVNMDIFTPKFHKFFLVKRELIYSYLDKVKHNNKIISSSSKAHKLKSKDPLSSKNSMFYFNKIIDKLEIEKILDLILYYFFKLVTYNNSDYENINQLKFAIDFGKNICREYLVILYKEYLTSNKNIQFSVWKSQNEDIVQPFEDNTVLFDLIGTRLFVELLIQADLVYEEIIISKEEKNKQFKILSLSKEVLQVLENKKIYIVPLKLPMIVEPKPYSFNVLGGYLLNDIEKTESLLINKANYKQNSEIVKDNIIYDMVNNINKTSYKINKKVLDFIEEFGVEFGLIEDINQKHPLENIKRNKRQDKIYRAYKSKILLEQNILGIANTFVNMSIYFPVRLDQRGRIYCEPFYFNYQSGELAKSLISFTFPGIINRKNTNAIEYFKAYGANCYGHGLDKKSYTKRAEWLDNNIADIIDYKNGKLLTKAKNKCLFLAFCMEYTRFTEFLEQDSIEFQTYLPIQLDATCNGFQHLALLSTETRIFKELNISKTTKKDDPKDFYFYMKNSLSFIFKENSNNEKLSDIDRVSYNRLYAFPWDRKNIKQAIMTIPYNASLRSIIKYIKDTLKICDFNEEEYEIYKKNEEYRKNKQIKKVKSIIRWYGMPDQVIPKRMINDKDIILLSKAINDIINKDFPKITKLSDYLFNVADICNKLEIPISWALPHGLHVNQSYLLTKTATIKPFTFIKSSFKLRVAYNTKFDLSKQKIALMPNLIHSLDGTSLSLLYHRFFESHKPIVNFYAIHDCFTTTCDKVDSLIDLLKTVYLSIYTENSYLRKFDQGIIDSILYHYGNDCVYNSDNRTFTIGKKDYKLYDIEEVLGKNLPTNLTSDLIKGSQYLVI